MTDHAARPPADEALPEFRYHPDPVATGAVERLGRECRCCGRRRGWSYVLGTYGPTDLRDDVCPWCIADGSAAERFGAIFNNVDTAGAGAGAGVAPEVLREVRERTPGFSAWQAERWLFHCDDAAAFVGPAGWEELEDHPDALDALHSQVAGWGLEPHDVEAVVGSLDVDGSATAYLFRCVHCGTHLAYADME